MRSRKFIHISSDDPSHEAFERFFLERFYFLRRPYIAQKLERAACLLLYLSKQEGYRCGVLLLVWDNSNCLFQYRFFLFLLHFLLATIKPELVLLHTIFLKLRPNRFCYYHGVCLLCISFVAFPLHCGYVQFFPFFPLRSLCVTRCCLCNRSVDRVEPYSNDTSTRRVSLFDLLAME